MREELELSGVLFKGSDHKGEINKVDAGFYVALTGSGELPVNDSMLTSCLCTCSQTFPCLGASCFCPDRQHLCPGITLSNFLSSVSRGAGTQLMITDTNLPGHSCGGQWWLHRQISDRTIRLAASEKPHWLLFTRKIRRVVVRGAKSGACTSRKKHRCGTKNWRNQEVSTVPEAML